MGRKSKVMKVQNNNLPVFKSQKVDTKSLERAGFSEANIKDMQEIVNSKKQELDKYSGKDVYVIRSYDNTKGIVHISPEPPAKKILGIIPRKSDSYYRIVGKIGGERINSFPYDQKSFGTKMVEVFKALSVPGVLQKATQGRTLLGKTKFL